MTHLSLAGAWTLADAAGETLGPCAIPGDIHSALFALGKIGNPHVGQNEETMQWVGETSWEISRHLVIDEAALAGKWAVLELEFVDIFAELFVNGTSVALFGSTFQRYRIDLSSVLKAGDNEIRLRFSPVLDEANARAARQPFPIPYSISNNKAPNLNMVRKPQCHGGWDWGLCLLVMGVYAEPILHFYEKARIESAQIRQRHHADGTVTAIADVELVGPADAVVPVSFSVAGKTVTAEAKVSAENGGKVALALEIGKPDLWWPAGHGAQPLYEAVVSLPGDTVIRSVGFRKLEVVNEKDAVGASLIFRVNDVDIFAKGANWIPADALPARATPERTRALLSAAVEANMNMIRVWGGGFYEFDAFYDLCDELGLLVWQDMMFACSQYPSTPEFLAEVDIELRYQIKRLSSRPSIAIWCGDNEVVGSLTWYELSKNNRDRYLVNYDRLNRIIDKAVIETDPDRRFWPSSPCKGDLDYGDAWHDDSSGDMHFWDVWHSNKNFEHYYTVKPRFCSEFGFQSFPSMTGIRSFAKPDEWNATAPVMEFHQRDPAGNARIIDTMARYFRVPNGFENFVFVSQLQQALAIETAVRYWRSLKPHTMGTLYWQLNDVWPAISWSSIDHTLAWKTLHYHAKRFYMPVAIAARLLDGELIVSGLNDRHEDVPIEVKIRTIDLAGKTIGEHRASALLPPDRSIEVTRIAAPKATDRFYVIDVAVDGEFDPTLQFVQFPDVAKRFELPVAYLNVEEIGPGRFVLSADAPAFYVRPEAPGNTGHFDDASFLLLPNQPRTITFRPEDGVAMPKAADLTVHHLGATYR
ncbi:glycoside hydrolase family 2 protein [Kaistia dalseonensis]|uniref:beta-mannosidase n=1 Tax=Kaistia dalseonensis TaxID=410840 RepID=A0ABU0H977_9HYPH|nr:glycoside hydrolase family 2 protein [Kaistia dalseonensis]MCX5495949.1 glycoside hydrolase family 2 protein [Kaistia dalseonensis]MDQ0438552.1 beta-mannosidase [Kaistia dalseonensis]